MAQRKHSPTAAGDSQATTGGGTERRSGRFGVSNWPVSTKLIAVLLLPALAAVAAGALRVTDRLTDFTRDTDNLAVTTAQVAALDLMTQLHDEQFVAVARATGAEDVANEVGDLDTSAQRTDTLVTDMASALQQVGGDVTDRLLPPFEVTMATVVQLREDVREGGTDPVTVAQRYDDAARAAHAIADALAGAIVVDDVQQQQALSAARLAQVLRFDALEDALVLAATAGGPGTVSLADFDRVAESRREARAAFGTDSTAEERAELIVARNAPPGIVRTRDFQPFRLALQNDRTPELTATVWASDSLVARGLTQTVRSEISVAQSERATALRDEARTSVIVETALILLLLLIAVAFTYGAARSIVGPLRILRDDALGIAQERLPSAIDEIRRHGSGETIRLEPVAVHTREETGQVARAFDAVHSQAIRLAGEQERLRQNVNEVFVNLSRRSQGLVERQLRLIDRLENDEQDPDQLAQLFRLDHLASRMRRYNDNLMVLAGSAGHARSSQAMAAVDVLRAAVSETEQYQRVVVEQAPDLTVSASASSDLVHLLAELLENATSFSPPDTEVTVEVTGTREHGLVVEVIDKGLGISQAELVALNDKLANPPVVDPAVPRQMGLFVVSQLAKRHGINVELRRHETSTGTVASVWVPPSGLVAGVDADQGTGTVAITDTGPQAPVATARLGPVRQPRPEPVRPEPAAPEPVRPEPARPEPARPAAAAGAGGVFSRAVAAPRAPVDDVPGRPSHEDAAAGSSGLSEADAEQYSRPGGGIFQTGEMQRPQRSPAADHRPAAGPDPAAAAADQGRPVEDPVSTTGSLRRPVSQEPPRPPASNPPRIEETPLFFEVSAWFSRNVDESDGAVASDEPGQHPAVAEAPAATAAAATTSVATVETQNGRPADVEEPAVRDLPSVEPAPADRPVIPSRPTVSGRPEPGRSVPGRPVPGRPDPGRSVPGTGRPAAAGLGATRPVGGQAGQRPGGTPLPAREPRPVVRRTGFESGADEGWRAVEAVQSRSAQSEVTSAGLPRRTPRANLVPGSAAPVRQPVAATARSARDADVVRGRLSSYQRGLQSGRSKIRPGRPVTADQARQDADERRQA